MEICVVDVVAVGVRGILAGFVTTLGGAKSVGCGFIGHSLDWFMQKSKMLDPSSGEGRVVNALIVALSHCATSLRSSLPEVPGACCRCWWTALRPVGSCCKRDLRCRTRLGALEGSSGSSNVA